LNNWAEDILLLYCLTVETEQMMECLLEAKADANLREMKNEIRTNQERMEEKTEAI
jgi:hypothetical protein